MKCKFCKYYNDIWDISGYCRFNAPVVRKEQRQKYNATLGKHVDFTEEVCHTEWAKVTEDSFCGQFETKKEDWES